MPLAVLVPHTNTLPRYCAAATHRAYHGRSPLVPYTRQAGTILGREDHIDPRSIIHTALRRAYGLTSSILIYSFSP